MKKFASIVSAVFSPLFVPTYGVVLALYTSILAYVDLSAKIWAIGCTLAITGVAPLIVIFCLHKFGKITDVGLNKQDERAIPYGISLLCYVAEIFFLRSVHSPGWLTLFMVGGSVALLIDAIVNLKWKISAHATGMGGLVALGFHILTRSLYVWPSTQWIMMGLVILAGLVCSCRLLLQRHTMGQLAAGFAVGFLSVFIATNFDH